MTKQVCSILSNQDNELVDLTDSNVHYIQTLSQLLSHVAAMNTCTVFILTAFLSDDITTITHCLMMMIRPPGVYCPHPPLLQTLHSSWAGNLATGHCRPCLTPESDTGPRPDAVFLVWVWAQGMQERISEQLLKKYGTQSLWKCSNIYLFWN